MTNMIVVVALWLANSLEPTMLIVKNQETACAVVQRAMKTPGIYETNSAMAYVIFPELVGVNAVVKTEALTCPSHRALDLSSVLGGPELDEIDRSLAGKTCRHYANKKNWKGYFDCVSRNMPLEDKSK